MLDRALRAGLEPWRRPTAVHDPAKIMLDLAVSLAVGGDCLADIATLREAPAVFGPVASDPTVSRLITTLAGNIGKACAAIDPPARPPAGKCGPGPGPKRLIMMPTIGGRWSSTPHPDDRALGEGQASPTFEPGFGHRPLTAFVDHGLAGAGEPVAMLLRRGNAGSNTATDHITVIRSALRHLPADGQQGHRSGRSVLVRIDGAESTHELLDWLTARNLSYSVGFGLPDHTADLLTKVLEQAWSPALDADGMSVTAHGWPS